MIQLGGRGRRLRIALAVCLLAIAGIGMARLATSSPSSTPSTHANTVSPSRVDFYLLNFSTDPSPALSVTWWVNGVGKGIEADFVNDKLHITNDSGLTETDFIGWKSFSVGKDGIPLFGVTSDHLGLHYYYAAQNGNDRCLSGNVRATQDGQGFIGPNGSYVKIRSGGSIRAEGGLPLTLSPMTGGGYLYKEYLGGKVVTVEYAGTNHAKLSDALCS